MVLDRVRRRLAADPPDDPMVSSEQTSAPGSSAGAPTRRKVRASDSYAYHSMARAATEADPLEHTRILGHDGSCV
jgi:hypothetical protein